MNKENDITYIFNYYNIKHKLIHEFIIYIQLIHVLNIGFDNVIFPSDTSNILYKQMNGLLLNYIQRAFVNHINAGMYSCQS
jgi:hypothetical protein